METITYSVSDTDRADGEAAISAAVSALQGVARVDVDVATKRVVVSGHELDGGAIHDAIHEAGYGARRVIELSEPYVPRPVAALGTWRHGHWRLKQYTIAYRREAARPELIEAAEAVAAATLPTPAITATRYGVGFLGIHDGRGAGLVFVDWWESENDLQHHVFLSPDDDRGTLRPAAPTDLAASVWDLAVSRTSGRPGTGTSSHPPRPTWTPISRISSTAGCERPPSGGPRPRPSRRRRAPGRP